MTSATETTAVERELIVAALDEITIPGDNHRKDLGDLAALAESIRQIGIVQPPTVRRREGGGYDLVAGQRRVNASRLAGLTEIPVIVCAYEDVESRRAQLVENAARLELAPAERAAAYQELLDLGMSEDSIAALTSEAASTVRAHVSLLTLPPKVRRELSRGAISFDEALLLTELADTPEYLGHAVKQARNGWSIAAAVREQLHERERAQRTAATLAELERRGVRLIEPVQETYSRTAKVQRLGDGWGRLPIRASQHVKEPCHAAFIDAYTGEPVYVCDQPQRHAGTVPGIVSSADRKAERAAKRAATAARKQAIADRAAVLTKHLAASRGLDKTALHVQRVGVLDASEDAAALACELLGVAVESEGWRDHVETLSQVADESPAQLRRVALALALARGELYARREYTGRREDPLLRAHLAYLSGVGYTPSESEQAFLERPAASVDGGEVEDGSVDGVSDEDAGATQ